MNNSGEGAFMLAGDIGGTKTEIGLFIKGKRRPILRRIETYASRGAPDLEILIEQFMKKHPLPVSGACFGIAGPVQKGQVRTTNLPWVVREDRLRKRFKWKQVRLINDLAAMAVSIPYLNRNELFPLNKGKAQKGQNLALLAPGTGLGESLLVYQEGVYIPVPSEGGHTDFPLNRMTEFALWQHLRKMYGHVSIERVLSGQGIWDIYSCLKKSGPEREPKWLKADIRESDPARVITEAALNKKQPLCVKTLEVFISILGAASGNLALTGMTLGGVYLGGGIPPKILPKLKEDIFMKSFTDKGRFKGLMEKIPVHVILNRRAALLGASITAFKEAGDQQ